MSAAKPLSDFFKIVVRNDRLQLDQNLNFKFILGSQPVNLINISESGAAVSSATEIKPTETNQFKLFFNDQVMLDKTVKVIRVVSKNQQFEYALAFDEILPENFVYNLKTCSEIGTGLSLSINGSGELDQTFLSICMRMKDYLVELKSNCELYEKSIYIQSFESKNAALEIAIEAFGNSALKNIRQFAHQIDKHLSNISDKERRKKHADFFRRNLGEYFVTAAFTGRAFYKPRGYAGDYEMMNQIYRNLPEGESLFQKIIHLYGINETSSVSVRLRKDFLKRKIDRLVKSKSTGKIYIGSLACGPAREVVEVLNEFSAEDLNRIVFVLMDQDHHAILNAQRNITKAIRTRKLDCEVNLLPLSVKQILEQTEESKALAQVRFDLLYTAGLYDYLPQPVAKNLTSIISESVADGGELIIGNFHPNNPTKTISDLVADWRLIHRDHRQMEDLISNSKFKSFDFYLDEVQIDLFIIAKK